MRITNSLLELHSTYRHGVYPVRWYLTLWAFTSRSRQHFTHIFTLSTLRFCRIWHNEVRRAWSFYLSTFTYLSAFALSLLPRDSSYSPVSQASLVLTIQLCGVSLETMTAISVDRYLALRYHMRYPNMMTSTRATCVAATFWCKNFILSLLSIWKTTAIHLVAVVFVALCFFISSITYSAIYRIVRHQSTSDSRPTASRTKYERGTKSQDTSEETRCKHIYILHLHGSLFFSRGCLLPNLGDL